MADDDHPRRKTIPTGRLLIDGQWRDAASGERDDERDARHETRARARRSTPSSQDRHVKLRGASSVAVSHERPGDCQ